MFRLDKVNKNVILWIVTGTTCLLSIFYLQWFIPALIVFILYDVIVYNLKGRKYTNQLMNPYRVSQIVLQSILIISLWIFVDFKQALYFQIIWITWGCDIGYYIYYYMTEWFEGWEVVLNELKGQINWGYSSIIGIIFGIISLSKGGKFNINISGRLLTIQAMVGLLLIIILVIFKI